MKLFGIEFGSNKKEQPLLDEAGVMTMGAQNDNTGTNVISNIGENIYKSTGRKMDYDVQKARESETIKYSPTKAIKPGSPIEMSLLVQIAGENNEQKTFPLVYIYKMDNETYEVVVGQISACHNLSDQAKKILDLMEKQLINNAQGKEGLEQVEEIRRLSKPNQSMRIPRIPFEFTLEGIDIITQKSPFIQEYKRTQVIKENHEGLEINGIYDQRKLNEMKKEKYIELAAEEKAKQEAKLAELKKQKSIENINDTLEKSSPELREQFLIGEKIAQYVTRKNQCIDMDGLTCFCKSAATEFMLLNHENEKNENLGLKSSLEQFVEIKEKGFANDVIEILNQIDDTIHESVIRKIEEDKIESVDRRMQKIEEVQYYRLLFKLLEKGRGTNFNLLLQTGKLNLHNLKEMFEKCGIKDEEVLSFLDHKQNIIEKQGKNKELTREDFRAEDRIVRNYYEFMMDSSSRRTTKEEEENMIFMESDIISTVMIQNNKKPMIVYSAIAGDAALYHFDTKRLDERSLASNLTSKVLPQMITDTYKVTPKEVENFKDSSVRNKSVCTRPLILADER